MKEKIEQFARGEYEYELPFLRLSVEEIEINVEAGKKYEGSFSISNNANRSMKGTLYSSNRLLTFTSRDFNGKDITITYLFDATYLKPSDMVKGNITVLSDCGELMLPFTAHVGATAISTSIGKIKNLFEFANLARMDWTEAKKVFRSEEFEGIILKNEEKYHVIYRNLLKSISTSQALEEFLIAVNKKSRINLSIDKTRLEYNIQNEDFMDKLVLTKNHWGYAEVRVSTDAPFIQLGQKFLWADSFIGNSHQISFVIKAENLRPGNNFGRIWIKTVHQTITVDVICKNIKGTRFDDLANKNRIYYKFSRNYLSFRIGHINMARYIQETESLLATINDLEDSTLVKLVKIHLALLSDRKRIVAQLLDEISQEETTLRKRSTFEYCAYLYLWALYRKDDETIRYVTDTINRYYMSGNYDWRILWFLLFTDKRYDRNRNYKLADIKEQYKAGCHSPILYYEAVCVYNEEPYLLRELTDFEIQVINFAIKNDCITKELALQYTYLANRLKKFHPIVFRGLTQLFHTYKKEEILSAICSLLIKGYKRDYKYFEWYKAGVKAQLRITELYEYYMYSVKEDCMDPLPQSLLLYFIYSSSLNDKKRAYLYANIIKNKSEHEQIYQSYYKKMEVFAQRQLESKNISSNLAILYKEFIGKSSFQSEYAKYLPQVMFTQKLHCDNPNMVSVLVVHKERDEEEIIPLNEGRAYIQLYTDMAEIFLIDSIGNRFVASVNYSLRPLLLPEDFYSINLDYEDHSNLLLHLFDHYQKNRIINDESIKIRKLALEVPGLKETYYIDCLLTLIEYYYENYNADLLEHYLLRLDLSKVKETNRIKYLEYMVIRGYYDKALEALKYFGVEGISIQRLVKLCSGWITYSGLDTKEELLVSLCYYIFTQGKYDLAILNYLVKYYNGSTLDMLYLWKAAMDFDMDARDLEERLLTQLLYTESDRKEIFTVFLEYYRKVTNHQLVRAFLTYYSYKYLVHGMDIDEELFPIIRRELNYEENNINLLAWLKYVSNESSFGQADKDFISYHLDRFVRKGIILPFFKKFQGFVKFSQGIMDKSYVEHITNPKKQVFIHYRLKDSDKDFISERMSNVFLGIHVKDFILFYNEDLEYYFTEESGEEVNTTECFNLSYSMEDGKEQDSKYSRINTMLKALYMKDEANLLDMMSSYVETEYIIGECYKPLP